MSDSMRLRKAISHAPRVPLSEIAPLVRRPVTINVNSAYPELGVRSFGRGTFHKPAVPGGEVGSKKLFSIHAGDLLFNIVFAWEGAVAVADVTDEGRVGSHRFLTCVADSTRADAKFLKSWLLTKEGLDELGRASPGGAGRNRTLGIKALEAVRVPLPSLAEQQAIVSRLDRTAAAIKNIQRLRGEIRDDLASLIFRANESCAVGPCQLSDALTLDEDRVIISPESEYPQIGIRGFGGGLFSKASISWGETTYRHFNRLSAGHFVVSQVKGWEGAVAVCGSEHAGKFASPEYRTFRCNLGVLRSTYFSYLCLTPWFHSKLAPATRGQGARRERLRPEMLAAISIPLPSVEVQEGLESVFARVEAAASFSNATDLDQLLPSILDEVFG